MAIEPLGMDALLAKLNAVRDLTKGLPVAAPKEGGAGIKSHRVLIPVGPEPVIVTGIDADRLENILAAFFRPEARRKNIFERYFPFLLRREE